MIRELKRYVVQTAGGEKEYIELTMDHDDTKPDAAGYVNGSKITETDTGDVYMLNEDAGEWVKEFSLQDLGGGSGSALPPVTSDDNGDVLTVVGGVWAKADAPVPAVETTDKGKYLHTNAETGDLEWSEASGGTEFFIVTIDVELNTSSVVQSSVADKTFDEITGKMDEGVPVLFHIKYHQYNYIFEIGYLNAFKMGSGDTADICAHSEHYNGGYITDSFYSISFTDRCSTTRITYQSPTT